MKFFTADHHFGHQKILKYCQRPFETCDEMDATMIANWNEVVGKDDEVYHIGDFTLGGLEIFVEYLRQLTGYIRILSNLDHHDRFWLKQLGNEHVASASGHDIEILPPLYSLELDNVMRGHYRQMIVMCHFPMARWNKGHYGSWHLYGHSHGRFHQTGLAMDVGVDCNDFTPISLDQIVERFNHASDKRSSN